MYQQKRVTKINLLHLYSNQANPSYHSFLFFFFFFKTNHPQTPTHALTKKRKLKKKNQKKKIKSYYTCGPTPNPKRVKKERTAIVVKASMHWPTPPADPSMPRIFRHQSTVSLTNLPCTSSTKLSHHHKLHH